MGCASSAPAPIMPGDQPADSTTRPDRRRSITNMAPGRKKAAKKWAKDDPNSTATIAPPEKKEIVPYVSPVLPDAQGSEALPDATETGIPPASDEAADADPTPTPEATDTEVPAPPAEDAPPAENAAPEDDAAPAEDSAPA